MHQLAQLFFVGGCPPSYIPNRLPTLNAHYQWPIFDSKLPGEYVPVPPYKLVGFFVVVVMNIVLSNF